MNDFELESKLKSILLPMRTDEYWEHFPSHVRSQLRPVVVECPQKTFTHRLAWGSAVTLAYLTFALMLWPAFQIALQDARAFRRELAQLPSHLRVFMADEHGMHHLIADQP
jgi:hypothetical protein